MSTRERLRHLRRKLEVVTQAEGEQVSLDHLSELTTQLRGPLDGLERHVKRCRALGVSPEQSHRDRLSEKLDNLRTEYSEAPQEVGQGRTFAEFKDAVVDAVKALRDSADQRSEEIRSKALGRVPRGLMDFWASIPDLADDADKLRTDLLELETNSRPPATASECETFLRTCERIEERLQRLMEFEAPADVRRFVTAAASSRGASWQSLTDEVRSWLSKHDMLDKLRLKL